MFSNYWLIRSHKDHILSFEQGNDKVKKLTELAAVEVQSGFWKLSTQTFGEAILQVQKLIEKNTLPAEVRDDLWLDVSTALKSAGFYVQAFHVLKNLSSEWLVNAETRILRAQIEIESKPQKKVKSVEKNNKSLKVDYHIIVPEAEEGGQLNSGVDILEAAYGPSLTRPPK